MPTASIRRLIDLFTRTGSNHLSLELYIVFLDMSVEKNTFWFWVNQEFLVNAYIPEMPISTFFCFFFFLMILAHLLFTLLDSTLVLLLFGTEPNSTRRSSEMAQERLLIITKPCDIDSLFRFGALWYRELNLTSLRIHLYPKTPFMKLWIHSTTTSDFSWLPSSSSTTSIFFWQLLLQRQLVLRFILWKNPVKCFTFSLLVRLKYLTLEAVRQPTSLRPFIHQEQK